MGGRRGEEEEEEDPTSLRLLGGLDVLKCIADMCLPAQFTEKEAASLL